MPIYEFRCPACGSRFEELVGLGARAERCPRCGAEAPERVFSAHAAPLGLVRTPRELRRQERQNAKLREATKAEFKEGRRRAREQKARAPGRGGAPGGDA